MILYLKNWFPAAAQARTVARFMTAGALSGVIGGPISGALLGLDHTFKLAGWQWLFLVEGLPAIVLGVVVAAYLTDHPKDAHWLGEEHRNWLVDTLRLEKESHPDAGQSATAALWRANVVIPILLLVLFYFGSNTFVYGISFFLPKLIRSLSGVSVLVIGLLSAIPYVAAAITMVIVGWHSDRTKERRLHVSVAAFVGSIAMVAAAYSHSLTVTILALSVALMGVWSCYGPFWAIPSSMLSGTAAAIGIAAINSLGNLGGLFGPWIIGKVRDQTGGFRGGFLAIGATLAVGAFALLLVRVPGIPAKSAGKT